MKWSALSGSAKAILASVVLAAVVVSLGAFTRLVDAGLGCPDWPGCYGHILWPDTAQEIALAEQAFPDAPVDADKTWPEMVHRYFASALGFVILCFAVYSWKHRKQQNTPVKLPLFLLALVILQGLFGMWTVTLKLWPQVVTTHLLGGFTTLTLLWLMFLRLSHRDWQLQKVTTSLTPRGLTRLRKLAMAGLVAVVLQISLGGWTTSNYAALACVDFPTCHGELVPAMDFKEGFNFTQDIGPNYLGGVMDSDGRTAIHWSHRVGALVVTGVLLLLMAALIRTGSAHLKKLAGVIALVLAIQIALGITNIVAILPLSVAVAHNGVGALLLMVMATVNYRLWCFVSASEQDAAIGLNPTAVTSNI
ncbi:MAG: COX15/CtaA family protein [Candidatus Pelagadaptatus aseana]|uniref:COX15/CtaA family protein n=1 Tax=Candidatus Pelagadaptatus aseana TaxID=3120508 RepID=UPI0039B15ECB